MIEPYKIYIDIIFNLDFAVQVEMHNALNVPVLPLRLPAANVGQTDFEIGFYTRTDASKNDDSEANIDVCYVCLGYPRRAVANLACKHVICDRCATEQFIKNPATGHQHTIACGICRQHIRLNQCVIEEEFVPWMVAKIAEGTFRCEECGDFEGTRKELDEHQVYDCHLRMIRCPNVGCNLIQPAYMLAGWHFAHCEYYRQYCETCLLPILAADFAVHNCTTELRSAVQCMINYK